MECPEGFEKDAREGLSTRALSAKYSMSQTRAKRLRQELTGEAPVRGRRAVMCALEVEIDTGRLDQVLELATYEEAREIIRRHLVDDQQKASACALILQMRLDSTLLNVNPQPEDSDAPANT